MEIPLEIDFIGQDLATLYDIDWDKANKKTPNCTSLNLHFNRLTNLHGLPVFSNIIELNLSSNHFRSCDLPELTKLPKLVTLDLSGMLR